MKTQVSRVDYPVYPKPQHVIVERLKPDDLTYTVAHQVGRIIGGAYAAQFEGAVTKANVPKGTFAEAYPQDEAGVESRRQRMAKAMKGGVSFWLARSGGTRRAAENAEPVGLVRAASNDENGVRSLDIHDIMVAPGAQHQGIGTYMMHAVLKWGSIEPALDTVRLDGFVVNADVNAWYESIGILPNPSVTTPAFHVGRERLELMRFESERTAAQIVETLETRHVGLHYALPQYSLQYSLA